MTRLTDPPPRNMVEFVKFTELFRGLAYVECVVVEQEMYASGRDTHVTLTLKPVIPSVGKLLSEEEERTVTFWQMQECLRTLANNGLKITDGPHMEIRGEPLETLGGGVVATRYYSELKVTVKQPNWRTKTGATP